MQVGLFPLTRPIINNLLQYYASKTFRWSFMSVIP